MPEYELRSAFPLAGKDFVAHGTTWQCKLAEVSDLRPEADRLCWFLVFESKGRDSRSSAEMRKLEIVTTATHLLQAGFPDDLTDRLLEWLLTEEQDGRREWLDY